MKIIIKCHTVEILVLAIILAFKVFCGMHIKEMATISKLLYYHFQFNYLKVISSYDMLLKTDPYFISNIQIAAFCLILSFQ